MANPLENEESTALILLDCHLLAPTYAEALQWMRKLSAGKRELALRFHQVEKTVGDLTDTILDDAEPQMNALEAADKAVSLLLSAFKHGNQRDQILSAARRLAFIPGGRIKACNHLLTLADKYADHVDSRMRFKSERTYYKANISAEFGSIDMLLARDILAPEWKALAQERNSDGSDWDAFNLKVKAIRVAWKVDRHFKKRPYLLFRTFLMASRCNKRRLAGTLATKAVGHLLPVELVDMVRDAICSTKKVRRHIQILNVRND